jgi:hypothetical protein
MKYARTPAPERVPPVPHPETVSVQPCGCSPNEAESCKNKRTRGSETEQVSSLEKRQRSADQEVLSCSRTCRKWFFFNTFAPLLLWLPQPHAFGSTDSGMSVSVNAGLGDLSLSLMNKHVCYLSLPSVDVRIKIADQRKKGRRKKNFSTPRSPTQTHSSKAPHFLTGTCSAYCCRYDLAPEP